MRSLTLKLSTCCILLFGWLPFCASTANELVSHRLEVRLEPESQRLQVRDRIHLPASAPVEFSLHRGLDPHIITPGVTLTKTASPLGSHILAHYRLNLPPDTRDFVVEYGGEIVHGFQTLRESPGRDRQLLAGTISSQGVFLDGGVGWYPMFQGSHYRFDLSVHLPQGWLAVSQGTGPQVATSEDDAPLIRWQEGHPQDDIYLIAAPFHYYSAQAGSVEAQVYLREPDPALARRYLDATSQYLDLYQALLGPYPYAKFALVENFWETGYGMPSFTLLGSRVLRLPFILHTSYPHEILHNWWGNGVYVDYAGGNWSEGLTAYLADHLLKEQQGEAIEYRRSALQRFGDFVRTDSDFPLTEFRARHTTASQAVGYDKSLMLFHMLRRKLGDAEFTEGLRRFYAENRFQTAGFEQIQQAFEAVSGQDLNAFFRQWTKRTGAPALAVDDIEVSETDRGYRLSGVLRQTQTEPAFQLDVPLHIYLEPPAAPMVLSQPMVAKSTRFEVELPARPLRLEVDPWFDLFRQLDPTEAPPTLGKLLGADEALFVLPADAPEALLAGYRNLARQWARGYRHTSIELDRDLKALPPHIPTWLLGWENRFAGRFLSRLDNGLFRRDGNSLDLAGHSFATTNLSLALVDAAPGSGNISALIATDDARALGGLARKLPHYGKYSYLLFTGDGPNNRLKGQWPVTNSPLSIPLTDQKVNIQPLRPTPLWPADGDVPADARGHPNH
ncbi:MAG: M1 family aminopeptidase [Chromatiales bacterium]|jgi:hypothetical protein